MRRNAQSVRLGPLRRIRVHLNVFRALAERSRRFRDRLPVMNAPKVKWRPRPLHPHAQHVLPERMLIKLSRLRVLIVPLGNSHHQRGRVSVSIALRAQLQLPLAAVAVQRAWLERMLRTLAWRRVLIVQRGRSVRLVRTFVYCAQLDQPLSRVPQAALCVLQGDIRARVVAIAAPNALPVPSRVMPA